MLILEFTEQVAVAVLAELGDQELQLKVATVVQQYFLL